MPTGFGSLLASSAAAQTDLRDIINTFKYLRHLVVCTTRASDIFLLADQEIKATHTPLRLRPYAVHSENFRLSIS